MCKYYCLVRFLLYPGKLFLDGRRVRFSWRVMRTFDGKRRYRFFPCKKPETGHSNDVNNADYLTPLQEKMMATQPDMILQYAHFLSDEYKKKGIKNPIVTAESYVTLNGSGSRLFIDSTVNLAQQPESFAAYTWILPFDKK